MGSFFKNNQNLATSVDYQLNQIKESHIIPNGTYILVKFYCNNRNGEILLFDDLDFSIIVGLLIKEIKTDKYRTIDKREIYSYSINGDFLNLKLRNHEKLKIRLQ